MKSIYINKQHAASINDVWYKLGSENTQNIVSQGPNMASCQMHQVAQVWFALLNIHFNSANLLSITGHGYFSRYASRQALSHFPNQSCFTLEGL